MKNLIISIACLLVLIIPWGIYGKYSSDTIEDYKAIITEQVIPSIESGRWAEAEKSFSALSADWDRYKMISAYFINTNTVNEADGFIAKAHYYIKLHDAPNASAESAYLMYQLEFLHENELPTMENIF